MASYSCSAVQDLSIEHFKLCFGPNLDVGNFGLVCATQECQSLNLWCWQNVLHYKIYIILKNKLPYKMLHSESCPYMLHRIWVWSERGAHGTEVKTTVVAIAVHHARLELKLNAACIDTNHSATFCNNLEASQTYALTLLRGAQPFDWEPRSV